MKSGRPEQHRSNDYPSPFQKKTLWHAITGASMLSIGAMAVFVIWVLARVFQFLQPVLVPIAFAGILAYLLEPLIKRLTDRGTPRFRAMMWVWLGFHGILVLLLLSVAVPTITEGARFLKDREKWMDSVGNFVTDTVSALDRVVEKVAGPQQKPEATASPAPEGTAAPEAGASPGKPEAAAAPVLPVPEPEGRIKAWARENSENIAKQITGFIGSGFQGVLGMFGYLVGFILVPLYLYYFLKESSSIKKNWSDYLPLRASKFKAELVDVLSEINGYLVAFFRGQMLVSLIDGALVGVCLAVIGLPYALLIGIFVALLGLIPYVGNIICWLAAVMISMAHFGATNDAGELVNTWESLPQVWAYPLIVTAIFITVQKINSLVTAPRIVGDAVGLHPLTVIFSVLFWSLLLGGLLGALLAVPLTAAVKVVFRRYIWERKVQPRIGPPSEYSMS